MSKEIYEQAKPLNPRSRFCPPFPQKQQLGGLNCPLSHVALLPYSLQSGRTCDTEHTRPRPVNTDSAPCPSIPCLLHTTRSVPKLYPSHLSQGCGGDDRGGGHGEPLPAHRPRLRGSDCGRARLKSCGEAGEGAKSWRSREAPWKQLCK